MDKFEEIRKYKDLLDSGIITQEEFDKKKEELLASQETSGSKKINDLISGAKEKTEKAKAAANEKIDEMKKKQAEEAEKKKLEEEERKIKEAELEKERAEQAKIEEERKQKEAEEKRAKEEERRKQKAEKKEQAKKKRKAFFAKKSVRIGIGIIIAFIVALIGYNIFAYVTRDTIKGDINDMTDYKVNNLTCSIPSNWSEDKESEKNSDGYPELKVFSRQDKNGYTMAVLKQYYLGDDCDIEKAINTDISDEWEPYDINIEADNSLAYSYSGTNEDGVEVRNYVAVVEKDYSAFETIISVRADGWEQNAIDTILTAPLYKSYKNPTVAESLDVKYTGSKDDGYAIKGSDFEVTVNCKDKESYKAESFEITPPEPTVKKGESTVIQVKCHGLNQDVEVKGKQVKEIVAEYSGDTEEGVEISKGNKDLKVTVKWDDGTEEVTSDYEMDSTIKLKAGGTGKAVIKAYGKETTLKVECSTLSEAQFKDKCKTRNYKELLRKASYAKYTKIYGKVVQDCGSDYYRITSGGSRWDDVYMVTVLSDDKLVEDDWVTCYGVTTGIYEYETVMGAQQKVPWLTAKYVDID